MCGIAGFIGASKNPAVSFQIITKLFERTQNRGKDAAGFWGTEVGSGKIIYHKEPIPSSLFIKLPIWKEVGKHNLDLLLVHCREASSGVGPPGINKNNHPFTSDCKSVALLHNGRVPDWDYNALKKKYKVTSSCDSEILLRMFEAGQLHEDNESESESELSPRLAGIRDIWSSSSRMAMAVVIGERIDEDKRLVWMFRNKLRPCWFADLRESMGQVFFFSEPEIWQEAMRKCPAAKLYLPSKIKTFELPTEEVWLFTVSAAGAFDKNFLQKFEVQKTGEFEPLEYDGEPLRISSACVAEVHTNLDENDNPIKFGSMLVHDDNDGYDDDNNDDDYEDFIDASKIVDICCNIKNYVQDIEDYATRDIRDGNISLQIYDNLMLLLSDIEIDLGEAWRITTK